jgi:hypothetical protein
MEAKEHTQWAARIGDALARLKRLPPGMPTAESREGASGRLDRATRPSTGCSSAKR